MRRWLLVVVIVSVGVSEAAARCTVTLEADGNTAAIQRAMERAGTRAPEVCLRPGTYKGARLIATRSCVLRAVGRGRVVLDAGGRGRVLTVMAKGAQVVLQGLTLTKGMAGEGGAIAVTDSSQLIIKDSWLTDNLARAGDGGAIALQAGSLRLVRSRVTRNKAKRASAIMVRSGARAELASTLIGDNKSDGGAMDAPVVVEAGANLKLLSSSLVYNSAQGVVVEGASANATPASLTVVSSIIMGTPDALHLTRKEAPRASVSHSVIYGGIGFVALDLNSSRGLPVFHLKDTERYRPTFGSPAIGIGHCASRLVRKDLRGRRRPRRCTAGALESTRQEIKKTLKARKQHKPKSAKQPWSYPAD